MVIPSEGDLFCFIFDPISEEVFIVGSFEMLRFDKS